MTARRIEAIRLATLAQDSIDENRKTAGKLTDNGVNN
jgi:hypothetical protein